MKKLMCVLALAGLMFGCASHEKNTGGTSDQTQMNSGANSTAPANPNANNSNGTQQ